MKYKINYNLLHEDYRKTIPKWEIFSGVRGSISHGTNFKDGNDDIDFISIIVPDIDYYFGLKTFSSRGTLDRKIEENDILIYEFLKFITLLSKGNPSALNILWLPDKFIINKNSVWEILSENKKIFSGKHVYYAFAGYANSQFKRMEQFKEFGGYMGDKRRKLFNQFGYDPKNASHLLRLLYQADEFLATGNLRVYRDKDKDFLISVKKGELPLEEIKKYANFMFNTVSLKYEISKLPDKPDYEEIDKLTTYILKETFKSRKEI